MAKKAQAGLELRTNAEQFKRGMREARGEIKGTGVDLKTLATGALATVGGVAALSSAFRIWRDDMMETREEAMKMEDAFKALYYYEKYYKEGMDDLRTTLLAVGTETGFLAKHTFAELADAFEVAKSNTDNETEAFALLEKALKRNMMLRKDVEGLIYAGAKAEEIFGREAGESMDLITEAGEKLTGTFNEIVAYFPVFGSWGKLAFGEVDDALEKTLAWYGVVLEKSQGASQAAMGLKETFRALGGSTEKSRKGLEQWGLTGLRPLEKIVKIKEKLDTVDPENWIMTVSELARSAEAQKGIVDLAMGIGKIKEYHEAFVGVRGVGPAVWERYRARPIAERERFEAELVAARAERGMRPAGAWELYTERPWRRARAEYPWWQAPWRYMQFREEALREGGIEQMPGGWTGFQRRFLTSPRSLEPIPVKIVEDETRGKGGEPPGD